MRLAQFAATILSVLTCHLIWTVSAIDPDLPFGDINVVVLTDVHSWVGGHGRQEPYYDADYGDVVSFYERLKEHCEEEMDGDLWFVSNGDWADGTGLSGAPEPTSLIPLLEKMPWDAVTCGNHELYEASNVEYMTRPGGFVDWFGNRYVTTNILVEDEDGERNHLGVRHKILHGKKADLLVFGFLYNMEDATHRIKVEKVETIVKEKWFIKTMKKDEFDAILVLAHMDMLDPLVGVIRRAIRGVVGDTMPIQFITGHTHYRGEARLDDWSTSFEAGRYLDTVGFVSFPTHATAKAADPTANQTDYFESVFLDANTEVLSNVLNMEDMTTENGHALSKFIEKTRDKMGLTEEIGCAPGEFFVGVSMENPISLWRLYRDEVLPAMFYSKEDTEEGKSIMLVSQESFRYNIYSTSRLVQDDVWAVAPFNDTVMFMGVFSGETILKTNSSINAMSDPSYALPEYLLMGNVDKDRDYKLYTHDFDVGRIKTELSKFVPHVKIEPQPTAYTSTMIWLAFVVENWPCNGLLGQLPDWFPTPDNVTKKLGRGNDETAKRIVTIVLIVLALLVVCTVLCCCRIWLRYVLGGRQPVTFDELEALEPGGDGNDLDLTENDREML